MCLGKVLGGLLGMKASTPQIVMPTTTARDLLPNTETKTPEEPTFGSESYEDRVNAKSRKKLKIDINKEVVTNNSPYSANQKMVNY